MPREKTVKFKRLRYPDLKEMFGNPGFPGFAGRISKHFKWYDLPFSFYNGVEGKIVPKIRCNEYIGPALISALREIKDFYGINKIVDLGLDIECGGSVNIRRTRNGKYWSVHAWGMAADLWCHMGQMGKKPSVPAKVVRIMKKHGFFWGGDFPTPDGMHFSACFG